MSDNTYNKVTNFINKHRMIEADDLVAVGVSGGADSVCLLHLLWRLSGEVPCRIIAVHIDHGVREESDQDAAYVEQLCRRMDVPFFLKKVDMGGYAREHGLSSEEAGRQLRYAAYEEALTQYRRGNEKCKIAVAHNANDRAETMLFHIFRGSGMRGIRSIQPVREHVIRPVLCLEREEIEQYLAWHDLEYRIDTTNEGDEYTRNRIRHHILPYAERQICSGAVAHMGELADTLAETEDYLEKLTERIYKICVEEASAEKENNGPERLRVRCSRLLSEEPVIYKRVLLACLERLMPYRKDITRQHISDLVKLMEKQGSKELSLPYEIRVYKEYDKLILSRNTDITVCRENEERTDKTYTVAPPTEILLPNGDTIAFSFLENKVIFCEKEQNIPENRYTKWFDYDKITTTLVLRTRQQGDYLTIDTALHTKSVKQYMIDEKIPKMQRDSMYILADGSHILWIPGYRISERYKVDKSTKRILQVQLRGGYYGGTN